MESEAKNSGQIGVDGNSLQLVEKSMRRTRKRGLKNSAFVRIERKHQGKFLAISRGPDKKVVAFADSYGALLEAANRLGVGDFSIITAPRQGVLYSH